MVRQIILYLNFFQLQ